MVIKFGKVGMGLGFCGVVCCICEVFCGVVVMYLYIVIGGGGGSFWSCGDVFVFE